MANIDRSPPALYHGTDVWRFRVSPGYPSLARGAGARHPVSPTRIDRADTPHPLARPRVQRAPLGRPRLDSLIEDARGARWARVDPDSGAPSARRNAARRGATQNCSLKEQISAWFFIKRPPRSRAGDICATPPWKRPGAPV